MKFKIVISFLAITLIHGKTFAELELKILDKMRDAIVEAEREPTRENLLAMGKVAFWMSADEFEWTEEYEVEQKRLILQAAAIPGHAKIYTDELELRRGDYLPRPDGTTTALSDHWRYDYLFRNVTVYPSPESVSVLGYLLDDFRNPVPERRRFDSMVVHENAYNAACALSLMGLRDFPMKPLVIPAAMKHAPNLEGMFSEIQDWYAKVKSGEIPFSFVGYAEEYRFNEDGSWEVGKVDPALVEAERVQELAKRKAIRISLAEPERELRRQREKLRTEAAKAASDAKTFPWIPVTVGFLVFTFIGGWWVWRKKHA